LLQGVIVSSDNPLFDVPLGNRAIEQIERGWKEGAARIEAQFSIDSLDPDVDRFLGHLLRYVTDHLDNKAFWDLTTINAPSDIDRFGANLRSTADVLYELAESRSKGKSDGDRIEGFLSAVRTVLYESRLLSWHAEALNRIRLLEITESNSQSPASPQAQAVGGSKRKRGPKPNYEEAARVAEIVARVASDFNWRAKLEEICEALDKAEIPCPKRWRNDKTCLCWSDQLERSLVVKAIEYRLDLARQAKARSAETPS
jgi:hypothetical protein